MEDQTEGKTGMSRLQNHRFLERAILDILMELLVEKVPLGTKSAHFEWYLHDGTSIPDLEVNGWKEKTN